jgi:gamma-glutamylcyclotransferase (GGCT)/AIG2-like uncharacterized protein YtfP
MAGHEHLPIFVYGTLMTGERNHFQALAAHIVRYEPATILGTLYYYRTEDYPALSEGTHRVTGQLLHVKNLPEVLDTMNRIEDYRGPGDPDNMYDFSICTAHTATGHDVRAYVYRINPRLLQTHAAEFSVIDSGDWVQFRRGRGHSE